MQTSLVWRLLDECPGLAPLLPHKEQWHPLQLSQGLLVTPGRLLQRALTYPRDGRLADKCFLQEQLCELPPPGSAVCSSEPRRTSELCRVTQEQGDDSGWGGLVLI